MVWFRHDVKTSYSFTKMGFQERPSEVVPARSGVDERNPQSRRVSQHTPGVMMIAGPHDLAGCSHPRFIKLSSVLSSTSS